MRHFLTVITCLSSLPYIITKIEERLRSSRDPLRRDVPQLMSDYGLLIGEVELSSERPSFQEQRHPILVIRPHFLGEKCGRRGKDDNNVG